MYSFSYLEPVFVPYPVLTVPSWPAYRFSKRQVRWSGILIFFRIFQFIVTHTVKGFGIVNKAEIDVFLELSCFFHDPVDVGNLISGSSAFYQTILNIWKFTVHILLKPGLKNFELWFQDSLKNIAIWCQSRLYDIGISVFYIRKYGIPTACIHILLWLSSLALRSKALLLTKEWLPCI